MYHLLWSRVEIKNKPVKLQAPQLHVLFALGESETDGGAWTLSLSGSARTYLRSFMLSRSCPGREPQSPFNLDLAVQTIVLHGF